MKKLNLWQGTGIWEGWRITTDHPTSSFDQPVLVNPDGIAFVPGDILRLDSVLTSAEAAAEWGVGESTVRNYAAQDKFGLQARRTAKNWIITRQGMQQVFGDPH